MICDANKSSDGMGEPPMPPQCRVSYNQVLSWRYSSVFTIPCRMLSFGFHPSERARAFLRRFDPQTARAALRMDAACVHSARYPPPLRDRVADQTGLAAADDATRAIRQGRVDPAMVEAAVADVEGLVAGRTEIDRGGSSYTADTLESMAAFQADYPEWKQVYDVPMILQEIYEANVDKWVPGSNA